MVRILHRAVCLHCDVEFGYPPCRGDVLFCCNAHRKAWFVKIKGEPLTHHKVLEILSYDADTGHFTWKVHTKKRGVDLYGIRAGYVHHKGYRAIEINRKRYAEHRLAWFYMTGRWPSLEIDHKNGVRDDNSFKNLREATDSQNAANAKRRQTSSCNLKGITRGRSGHYIAQIVDSGKVRYLGTFKTQEEAHARYFQEAIKVHGEFARAA